PAQQASPSMKKVDGSGGRTLREPCMADAPAQQASPSMKKVDGSGGRTSREPQSVIAHRNGIRILPVCVRCHKEEDLLIILRFIVSMTPR
ncbi:MAG: hypothetical protein KJ626_04850, partial [Verrucomicrobia bacterium]|nr:hypothetical protein [Verrucomicrobiota bacterium]